MIARLVLASAALALGLSACATGPVSTYRAELDQLTADCAERGGILSPTGATTGRPQTEYACRISGGASRIN